jgi:hypothetical protein
MSIMACHSPKLVRGHKIHISAQRSGAIPSLLIASLQTLAEKWTAVTTPTGHTHMLFMTFLVTTSDACEFKCSSGR